MKRKIKYRVKITPKDLGRSLQCPLCKEYVWIPFWGNVLKSICNCKKHLSFD